MEQERVSLKDFFYIPFWFVDLLHLPVIRWHPDDRTTAKQKLCLFLFLILIINQSWMLIGRSFAGGLDTTLEAARYSLYLGYASNAAMKALTVALNKSKIEKLSWSMLSTFPKMEKQYKDYKVQQYNADLQRTNKSITIFHMVITSAFSILPLFSSIIDYFLLGTVDEFPYRLPFMLYYPYNVKRPIVYVYAYIMENAGGYACSIFFLTCDLMLISLLHIISMYFENLVKQIEEFVPTGGAEDIKTLCGFLFRHEEILEYSTRVDDIFSISILLNYVATSGIICLIGLQIVAGTGTMDLIRFAFFLISMLAHVFYISLFATRMLDLSLRVGEAIFEHQWHGAEIRYQRMLLLPMARAQRGAHLTAFKFFDISMESFQSLMTTSYQFFTMMRTNMEG